MTTINDVAKSPRGILDLAIDGADEIDPNFVILKGGYGTFYREKIIELLADKFICVVDESKLTSSIGSHYKRTEL